MDKKQTSFTLGARLKELRQEHGLSHVQLSNQLKDKYNISVSRDSLMAYEVADDTRSKANKLPNLGMRVEYLYCLADFYGVSIDYLLGKTDIVSASMKTREVCEYTGLSEKSIESLSKYCGTRNNDFVLALIDNLLIEDNWAEWQARARRAALYKAKSEMRKPPKDTRDQFIEILLKEMRNARFPLIDQDISDMVEIPLQSAGDLYCNQAVQKIESIVLKTIEEYKECIKYEFQEVQAHPDSIDKEKVEAEMKLALYSAIQAFDKVLDEDEQVSK